MEEQDTCTTCRLVCHVHSEGMQRQPTSRPQLAAPLPLLGNDTLQVLLCPEACLRAVVSLGNLDNNSK